MSHAVKFDNPPIAEVACGVMFDQLNAFRAAHVGLFWESVRAEFPRIEEAPPISPVIEPAANTLPSLEVQFANLPPMRRTWLLNQNGSSLIQIQHDRFLFNWKRVSQTSDYPSYALVIEQFERHLGAFILFLKNSNIGSISYRQFELNYINIIDEKNGLSEKSSSDLLVDHSRNRSRPRFLPEPDTLNWSTSYPLPDDAGRLHVIAQSAMRIEPKEKVLRLELTARGIPKDASVIRPWFDLAHEWITCGFADCTSKALHDNVWGRTS
jgi:uncharacterized protein (TIGR04255 family)